MTTTLTRSPAATRADTRTVRRVAAAVLLPLGPLSVAILRGILPYHTTDEGSGLLDHAASALGRMDAVVWLGLLATLTLVPSALAAGRLAHRRAPRLTLAGLTLLVPAYLVLPIVNNDILVRTAAADADRTAALRILDAAGSHGAAAVAGVIFVAGHILGAILLGTALWRSGAIPAWAGICVIVSQPLHLVFAAIVPNAFLDAGAWGLTALGFAVAAARVLRTSNDDWDLGPTA
ncbi:MAG: hypothetical protein HOV78_04440 [Hamadaea sp.]|nr:hypothetical protein [Hamadaea sp.]